MVPVTKVSKILGEVLLILKRSFSLISHPHPYFRDSAFLSKDWGEPRVPLSQISLSSQIYGCGRQTPGSDKQGHRFFTVAQLQPLSLSGSKSAVEWRGQSDKLIRISLAGDIHIDLASISQKACPLSCLQLLSLHKCTQPSHLGSRPHFSPHSDTFHCLV